MLYQQPAAIHSDQISENTAMFFHILSDKSDLGNESVGFFQTDPIDFSITSPGIKIYQERLLARRVIKRCNNQKSV